MKNLGSSLARASNDLEYSARSFPDVGKISSAAVRADWKEYEMNQLHEEMRLQHMVAKDTLVNAIEELGMLQAALESVSESRAIARRMDAYILPSLENWVSSDTQPGSLSEILNEIDDLFSTENPR